MKRLHSTIWLSLLLSSVVLLLSCSHGYKDQEGNLFKTVTIGNQEWMAENLNVVTFQNGDSIPEAKSAKEWEKAAVNGLPAYCNYDDPAYSFKPGKLYNWFALNDPRILAPKGWHIPSDKEWRELSIELGMSQTEADKLHERGTIEGTKLKDPNDRNWNLNDSIPIAFSGFNAQTGGCRLNNGEYFTTNVIAVFWSSTETAIGGAYAYGIHPAPFFNRCDDNKGLGMSVRCIKNK